MTSTVKYPHFKRTENLQQNSLSNKTIYSIFKNQDQTDHGKRLLLYG